MIVTLSWPRFSQLIRELENIPDATNDELEVRLAHYARRTFDQCAAEFGIRVGGLSQPATSSVAYYFADISGAKDFTAPYGVDWTKLLSGLRWLRVVAVSITEPDWVTFCDPLIGGTMMSRHDDISTSLTNIGIDELPATVEKWVEHICWKTPENGNGDIQLRNALNPPEMQELLTQSVLGEAGLRDPLEKYNEVDQYRRQEEADYKAAQEARNAAFYKQFVR